jgi:hypothetical protein
MKESRKEMKRERDPTKKRKKRGGEKGVKLFDIRRGDRAG